MNSIVSSASRYVGLLFVAFILLSQGLLGCGPSQEEVKNQLREKGYTYEVDGFLKAARESSEAVDLFLAGGMSPNVQNSEGRTPLHEGAEAGKTSVVKNLLDAGANPNKQDDDGYTALLHVAEEGGLGAARTLLEEGADPSLKNEFGRAVLTRAAQTEHTEVLKVVLNQSNVDPNQRGRGDYTALISAAERALMGSVEELINAGADLNLQTKYGHTALIKAAEDGHGKVVGRLLDAGADPSIKNSDGETALNVAEGSARTILSREVTSSGK